MTTTFVSPITLIARHAAAEKRADARREAARQALAEAAEAKQTALARYSATR